MPFDTARTRIRDDVLDLKQWLAQGLEKAKRQHNEGSPGVQVCTRLSDLIDTIVLEVFDRALQDLAERPDELRSRITLVAYGGYGRREMAPYSDVDLMLLHRPGDLPSVTDLAKRLVKDFSDVGLDLGFSVRTHRQAIQLSARDAIVFSSLVDSRFLGGSVRLYSKFIKSFAAMTRRRSHSLINMVNQARREEQQKYGGTVYLLEPNVKRSRGGLRDLQLLRWVAFARFGNRDIKYLEGSGHLKLSDYRSLKKAQDFLLRLRNELHFHAGSSADVLYRGDQLRIAEAFAYEGHEGMLPVEEFMRAYFTHTSSVRQTVGYFVDGARWRYPRARRFLGMLSSHRVDRDFRVGPNFIFANRRGLERLRTNLASVLQVMDLTARYDVRIDHPTWVAIRDAMMEGDDLRVDRETASRFMSLMAQPNQLGRLLRRLHELRVLGRLIPGFEHARCLLQFNEYHKYTVDEHSIRAVERATEFQHQDSILGQTYRNIKSKQLLHLALLIHDLGKGFAEDHSEVGARIATEVAAQLYLSEKETETLRFLVHRHLMLSHLAFRRDTSDESIVLEHAVEIGSPNVLRMLYVLTCADFAAVGPGVFNEWKQEVLTLLYVRMMDALSGGISGSAESRLAAKRLELLRDPRVQSASTWFESQIARLPAAYLEGPGASTTLDDLDRLRLLPRDQVDAWGRFLPERNAVEYTVGVYEDHVSGIFHRITGALAAQGLEVLSAEIHTLSDRLCLDRFYVQDNDYRGEPPKDRYATVSRAIMRALQGDINEQPTFRRVWQTRPKPNVDVPLTRLPRRVRLDNSTSEQFTIIDVFAHDRPGLLFTLARTLYELGLSVGAARIATYLDQVVDVFYVVDRDGEKVDDDERMEQIRRTLMAAIAPSQSHEEH